MKKNIKDKSIQNNIKYCPFCGHWINVSSSKCNNCGEFLNIKSRRSLFHLVPNWVSVLATVMIAVAALLGVGRVSDILQKERIKAIENHLTWVEVSPIAFTTKGERDPKDSSDVTFWYLHFQAQNLGKKTGYFHIKNWEFKTNTRGAITKDAYKEGDRKFTVQPGEKIIWVISFVMSPAQHIDPIISGKDILYIKLEFDSKDMSNKELCNYVADWEYSKGKFSLKSDERKYRLIKE